jgi:hypothetical protein
MKYCIKCKQIIPKSCFSKHRSRQDGLQAVCKSCFKKWKNDYILKKKIVVENIICSKCGKLKHISNFNKCSVSKTGHASRCKECARIYAVRRNIIYTDNFGISIYSKKRKERINWLREQKSNKPCIDCGKIFDPECMDYDHVSGNKINSISRMVLNNYSYNDILKEMEKCELVCVLCHNKRTNNRSVRASIDKMSKTVKLNRKIIKDAKNVPCVICGELMEEYNMQFDHINPKDKFKNISQLQNYKTKTLLNEIKKCQVICALCHRRKSLVEQLHKKYV